MIAERFSGNRKIIESDTVYLYDRDDDLTLSFMFKERDFDVVIHGYYSDGEETNIMSLKFGSDCLPLERMPDGSSGTIRPVKIADVGEKKIYMHVWNNRVSDAVRKIEYTIYSADE